MKRLGFTLRAAAEDMARNRRLINAATAVLLVYLGWRAGAYPLNFGGGLWANLSMGIVGLVALAALPWRFTLLLTTLVVVGEGALRKWALPDHQPELYALKFLLLAAVYFRFLVEWAAGKERLIVPSKLSTPMLLYVGWVLVQAFNPALPDAWIGGIGVVQRLFMIPLFLLMPRMCREEKHWIWFFQFQVIVALAPLVLGVVQFFREPWDPINLGPYGEHGTGSNSGDFFKLIVTRPSSTFAFMSQFGGYVTVIHAIAFVLLMFRRRIGRVFEVSTYAVILLGMFALFALQSRGMMLLFVVFLGLLVWGQKRLALPAVRAVRGVALALVIAAGVGSWTYPEVGNYAFGRFIGVGMTAGTGEFLRRFGAILVSPLGGFVDPDGGVLGVGAGFRTNVAGRIAAVYSSSTPQVRFSLGAEQSVAGDIAAELGVPGLLFYYAFKLGLFVLLLREIRKNGSVGAMQGPYDGSSHGVTSEPSFLSPFPKRSTGDRPRSEMEGTRLLLLLAFYLQAIGLVTGLEEKNVVFAFQLWSCLGILPWAMKRRLDQEAPPRSDAPSPPTGSG